MSESGAVTGPADTAAGAFCHRRGPGFVTVMDRRAPGRAVRLTLDHPDLLAAFDLRAERTPPAAPDPARRTAVDLLAAEGPVRVDGDHAVALPPRVGRRPVPRTVI
ncbi:DUF5825 family protein [Streptomyces cellostaticus]|uniref:DUF5825 family protein n=1 Tax=Streptomyces TaxID=1883 RepID=UPI002025C62C|nr:DUF5825 family protein [Streptomyces cellostaticus]